MLALSSMPERHLQLHHFHHRNLKSDQTLMSSFRKAKKATSWLILRNTLNHLLGPRALPWTLNKNLGVQLP